jgi:hypothetical protein
MVETWGDGSPGRAVATVYEGIAAGTRVHRLDGTIGLMAACRVRITCATPSIRQVRQFLLVPTMDAMNQLAVRFTVIADRDGAEVLVFDPAA